MCRTADAALAGFATSQEWNGLAQRQLDCASDLVAPDAGIQLEFAPVIRLRAQIRLPDRGFFPVQGVFVAFVHPAPREFSHVQFDMPIVCPAVQHAYKPVEVGADWIRGVEVAMLRKQASMRECRLMAQAVVKQRLRREVGVRGTGALAILKHVDDIAP